MTIHYKENKVIEIEDLIALYEDAERSNYIEEPEKFKRAVDNSLYNISVWKNEELIGIIRVVGDGETIIYIQDIVVKSKYRDSGIDAHLLRMVLEKYRKVWEILVHTDDCLENRNFYERSGMLKSNKFNTIAFVKYNKNIRNN